MTKPAHYIFALAEDFTHLAFACAVEPLRIANLVSRRELYRWSYASANGETATASNGTVSLVHHSFADIPPCDRLFVLSGVNIEKPGQTHGELITALRRADRQHGTKVGALCSGAWILARAGFLNGMKAAIHWDFHDAFTEAFPEVNLLRNVFVADERYVTASGGSATADLMLHLIEREHGYDLSVAVADQMVYNAVRDATAAQRVSLQSRAGMRNPHLATAIDKMRQHLDDPISPARIASDLGISTRQLERLFGKYLNTSPKKYFMEMRLDRARHLLLQTEMSVTEVAVACGFESPGHFARVYRTAYGVTPMMQRGRMA
jgi:transcriptional regulator GlxA family with amidase domain